jgi:hypothetical protein
MLRAVPRFVGEVRVCAVMQNVCVLHKNSDPLSLSEFLGTGVKEL